MFPSSSMLFKDPYLGARAVELYLNTYAVLG